MSLLLGGIFTPNPSEVWPLSVMLIEQSPLGGSPGPLVGGEAWNAAKVGWRARVTPSCVLLWGPVTGF